MNRLKFLTPFALLILAVSLWMTPAEALQSPQVPLNPRSIPQFVDALPTLDIFAAAADSQILLNMNEFRVQVLSTGTPLPNPSLPAGTTVQPTDPTTWTYVWGYQRTSPTDSTSYIGPVVLATRNVPTEIKFVNNLGTVNTGTNTDTKVEFYKYAIDQTLHWGDPLNAEANNCAQGLPTADFFTGAGHSYPNYLTPCAQNYAGPIPAVVHLHGGELPPVLDGGPDAWFTSGTGAYKGHAFYSKDGGDATNYAIYRYPNTQEAAPIWFHDHLLGGTRLNVHAGLAGGYLINDPGLTLPAGLRPYGLTSVATDTSLTGDTPIIPLVIQDRMFDDKGQLFFPGDSAGGVLWSTNPDHPYWVPEFVGDSIVVNGKTWPYLALQAKRYRFLFLNGSNARTYVLNIPGGPKMYVIGTDGGYLNKPVPIKTLTIMPGERYDVIIDFTGQKGNFIMNNSGKTPYPRGGQPAGATVGRIMQFRVTPLAPTAANSLFNPALGTPIRTMVRLTTAGNLSVPAALTRLLTLNEDLALPIAVGSDPVTGLPVAYPGGPLEILVNNTKWMGKFNTGPCRGDFSLKTFTAWDGSDVNQCYSELPDEGSTEVWEIVNLTADAHPMHFHAVQFQIINRQNFDVAKYNAVYNAAFPTGVYTPGYGPPLVYGPYLDSTGTPVPLDARSNGKLGGNPDVAPFLRQTPVLPAPEEQGWKDTVVTMPGMVTRLAVRWAPQDVPAGTAGSFSFDPNGGHGYVWHCHIIDHEDNEMMRPTSITSSGAARTYNKCATPNADPAQNCY